MEHERKHNSMYLHSYCAYLLLYIIHMVKWGMFKGSPDSRGQNYPFN